MTIAELLRYMTGEHQAAINAIVDEAAHLPDDDAFMQIRRALYLKPDLDLDWSAADRMADGIVHECRMV